jgi:CelD/BcsL family acetyltransferase involved in cellulose biosynthesis
VSVAFAAAEFESAVVAGTDDPRLREAWRRLECMATLPTQTRTFHAALTATMLAGAELALFPAGNGNSIDALLPLCRAPGRLARWRLAGAREIHEPGDALCDGPDAAERLALRLARFKRPLVLDRMPAASPLVAAMRAAMRGRGIIVVRPAAPCPTIAIDPSWTDPASKFNPRRRSDFRRALRKAEALGAVTFEFGCPHAYEFDALFDEAIAVEMSGWKRAAGTAIGVDPVKYAFFRAYLRGECEAGRLRMAFLRIGGRAAAMQLAVALNGRLWLYKIGYDEAFRSCSPGTLLMLHAIGSAAGEGLEAFELLGNSEPWIAELWTEQVMPCVQLRTFPLSLAGLAALGSDCIYWLGCRLGLLRP